MSRPKELVQSNIQAMSNNSNTMAKNRDGEDIVVPPKDEEEIMLEKLVFGDIQGFETNLRKLDNLYDYSSEEQDISDDSDESSNSDNDLENVQDDQLFFIDDAANEDQNDKDKMDIDEESHSEDNEEYESHDDSENAWDDSDDERLNISLLSSDKTKKLRKSETDSSINGKSYIARLRSQFEKIYPKPEWVEKLQEDVDEEDEDNSDVADLGDNDDQEISEVSDNNNNAVLKLLSSTQRFIITKQLKLISPNKISISRLKDANHSKISKAAIQSLSFHHSHPLLLTGGFDRTLRIYHIDGKVNNVVTTLHLRNSPITSCYFSPIPSKDNKNLIFAGGRRRYMNKWDINTGEIEKISRMYGHEQLQRSMEYFKISSKGTYIGLTGSSGWCNILNGLTGQWIKGFKIEGTIVDFEFSDDESFIIVINSAGEVWEFELSNDTSKTNSKNPSNHHNKIIRRWQDDSGAGVTKVKLGGPKNRWLAIGTNNGIVNIYDRNTLESGNTKPIKTVDNLVTSISSLDFSPDGQILCIASRAKRDALRLVHLPSCSVYSNWPTSGTPLGRVTAVTFSPNNEMLAIGNEGGKVTLWRLNHY